MKTKEEINSKLDELKKDKEKFEEFMADVYNNDGQLKQKIKTHTWRIERQIEILEWVLDRHLDF